MVMEKLFPDMESVSHFDTKGDLYKNDNHRGPGGDSIRNARVGAYPLRDGGYKLLF